MKWADNLNILWHNDVLRHTTTYFPPLIPDEVIRSKDGAPLINVFEQNTFQIPTAHWECSCGKEWL